ncbi:MAG: hypothetical protein WA828_10635 [Coleofasciculaceae cyanobacterium]
MLQTIKINNASVSSLVTLWTQRYLPSLATLSQTDKLTAAELVAAATPEAKSKTVTKLKRLIQINCECAAIKTDVLFSYIPNVVNLSESQALAKYVSQVYEAALKIYQQSSLSVWKNKFPLLLHTGEDLQLPVLGMPEIKQLLIALEPLLAELQRQHLIVEDSRTIGFMTTQFHFSTQLVLNKLTVPEQVLISPYFKFIEEQVCMPWARVCNAAASHDLNSPKLMVVEQLLPQSYEIAVDVCHRAVRLYPNSSSQRGYLSHPGIMASTIRDLQMMQSYLWLSVLEGNLDSVEQALLPLCVMVFPSIGVTWRLVSQMLKLLMEEVTARVEPQNKALILPYTEAMQQLFASLELVAS